MNIGDREIGPNEPCLIVAEVGLAHEGSVQLAHAYVDAVAKAGADAVKFQCHIAEAESTPEEEWRVKPRWRQDLCRYDYWERTGFTFNQWDSLKWHADKCGLLFLCSPFSVEAVNLLNPLVPAWKIPSGEVTNRELLEAVKATGKPVLLSTGMATGREVMDALSVWGSPIVGDVMVMQCTSKYPCPPEDIGLGNGFDGFSDHSGTIYAGLAAVTLGCQVLEVHVKLSAHDQGFDAAASITPEQLTQLVEGVRFIEKARKRTDKAAIAKELEPMRELFLRKHERKAIA